MQLVSLLHIRIKNIMNQFGQRFGKIFGTLDVTIDNLEHLLLVCVLADREI